MEKESGCGTNQSRKCIPWTILKKMPAIRKDFLSRSLGYLSAKYGFLVPSDIVPGTYDVSFKFPGSHPITVKELRKQVQERDMDKYEEIIVLGGKLYVHIVEEVFLSKKVKAPLSGCRGIGYMMQLLNNAIRNHQRL